MTTRRPFTSSAAAMGTQAAAEAKAGEGPVRTAPVTLPAGGGTPTSRTSFTSPATEDRTGAAGAKTGEQRRATHAPLTPPAPYGNPAGSEAHVTASGPAAPTARLLPPVSNPEDQEITVEPNLPRADGGAGEFVDRNEAEEAAVRDLTARGYRAVTSEQWSRQGALDVLREQMRRNAGDPRLEIIERYAAALADRLTEFTDVSQQDLATVLLAAGASVGSLAIMQRPPGPMLAEILQAAADVLDRRANGGEPS
ncbi:hypothetical protein [Streptomyces sp. NPDC002328]|uniref:hypothetical protein n=1 Tax=Streptomyces sp. NPDC002328 TaxID=3364642 RepID=UPI003679C527